MVIGVGKDHVIELPVSTGRVPSDVTKLTVCKVEIGLMRRRGKRGCVTAKSIDRGGLGWKV